MGKWAETLGRGEEFHMAAFRAYFADGLNIAKVSVLTEVAKSINLDAAEAERVLNEGVFKKSVDRDWEYSRANGITAVPTFMANGRILVGAQPYNEIEKLILSSSAK